jgi:nitroreductase
MTVAPRQPSHPVDSQFVDRWSPRSFASQPVTDAELASLLEAARWAPSCMNEQPWVILHARTEADRARFTQLLAPGNQVWAGKAPLLMFIFARKSFARDGSPNRFAMFDAGAAWVSLALEAGKLGLHAHGMGGIDYEKVFGALGVPADKFDVCCAVAVGHLGPKDALPEAFREREGPSPRKEVSTWAMEGSFKG